MRIMVGDKRIEVRPWADGQVLLMTSDWDIKRELVARCDEGFGEVMTDPDIEFSHDDTEGVMHFIVDPEEIWLGIDLKTLKIEAVLNLNGEMDELGPEEEWEDVEDDS